MLSFFPRGVLDEILNLIESVSGIFLPTLGREIIMDIYNYISEHGKHEVEEVRKSDGLATPDFLTPSTQTE